MTRTVTQICTLFLLVVLAVPAFAGKVLAKIEYFYSDDGTLIGKAFNGKRVNFEYDLRGQLLAVKDAQGKDLERYTYDPAGNRLSKTINGVTTTYTYDKANQLVTSTVNGVTTHYKYDAAGRMIQAGDKKYIYNGNNKVVAIWQNGDIVAKFEYNIDGQIAKAIYGDKVEEFMWDGLALIWRSGVTYINEPYVTGGNPVMAGDNVLFNDMLGNTLAVNGNPVEMTSFGETIDKNAFFTGKPMVDELGYSFLFRDYNPHQGKWTTTDPLGYPDGWNNLAYGNNQVTNGFDCLGGAWTTTDMYEHYKNNNGSSITLQQMGLKDAVFNVLNSAYNENWERGGEWFKGIYLPYSWGAGQNPTGYMDRMKSQIITKGEEKIDKNMQTGQAIFSYNIARGYNFSPLVWAMGGGDIRVTMSQYTITWKAESDGYIYYSISGTYNLHFSDIFTEPVDIPGVEWGTTYSYHDTWKNLTIDLTGRILE